MMNAKITLAAAVLAASLAGCAGTSNLDNEQAAAVEYIHGQADCDDTTRTYSELAWCYREAWFRVADDHGAIYDREVWVKYWNEVWAASHDYQKGLTTLAELEDLVETLAVPAVAFPFDRRMG